jgi:CHASE2 domain-containing sensor protein
MWLFRSWRKLYAENPVAVAMLWLGLGLGSLLAALLTWHDDPASPTLPALYTFGAGYVAMSFLHRRRSRSQR